MTRRLDLSLPDDERRLAASLRGPWRDLLYAPGPGFTSDLDPGVFVSSFVIVLDDGRAVRLSSISRPAFGSDLCRLHVEVLAAHRADVFGSFFEPSRRGRIYAMSAESLIEGQEPERPPSWSYEGLSLRGRLGDVRRVRLVRERVTGADDAAFAWSADRGVVVTNAAGEESLFLAQPGDAEGCALISPPGLYRALLGATPVPGASLAGLLGHGDGDAPLDVAVDLETLGE